ncbi:hypothetical protein GCM10028778_12570 [Barrientosiimonas marina]|uniref:Uncharacterized protein n=2 Tax=Lentibacillus kimchii TaxID=1542911 RepID=A0ABW2UVI4_9BACI
MDGFNHKAQERGSAARQPNHAISLKKTLEAIDISTDVEVRSFYSDQDIKEMRQELAKYDLK